MPDTPRTTKLREMLLDIEGDLAPLTLKVLIPTVDEQEHFIFGYYRERGSYPNE
ncbi:hypothetical protein ACFVVM_32385 [Nocardia sp. NPDC058176]|uniref:hypothetical protein n=1 Tax=Nocardia sp. NPDC058176 TaxID=3346368 RepID=UPI0036DBEE1A